MNYELKGKLDQLGRAVEDFIKRNDARLDAIEAKGKADPLLEERVDKTNRDISRLQKEVDEIIKRQCRKNFSSFDGSSEDSEYKQEFCGNYLRKGIVDRLLDVKSMSTDSDPDGGFAVPDEVENRVLSILTERSAIRRLARSVASSSEDHTVIVSRGGTESGWVSEKEDRPETAGSKLAEITIVPGEMYALPKATQRLLDDARFDIAAWIEAEIAVEFSRRESVSFITGNGVKQPKGILAYDTVANSSYEWGKIGYIPSGAATTFTNADMLIELQHALKSYYRNGASWVMSDGTQEHVRKFKDGEGVYIWRPGLEAGAPNVLLGKPVEIDDNMPSIGGGEYPIAFGNFREGYTIVDRGQTKILRDPYTQKPYVLFYTTKRVGGGITDYAAIKLLKVAST
jgi:HK97 family phage major capsid protein